MNLRQQIDLPIRYAAAAVVVACSALCAVAQAPVSPAPPDAPTLPAALPLPAATGREPAVAAPSPSIATEPVAPASDQGSAASAAESVRDPFWPIGWRPTPADRTTVVKDTSAPKSPIRWEEATRLLEVTALTQLPEGGFLAVIRGVGVVEPGDTIAVNYGGLTYRWEVRSITSEGIVPRRLSVTAQRGG